MIIAMYDHNILLLNITHKITLICLSLILCLLSSYAPRERFSKVSFYTFTARMFSNDTNSIASPVISVLIKEKRLDTFFLGLSFFAF